MKAFKNLKIGKRMIIGFLIIALIAGFIGVIGIVNLSGISTNYSSRYTNTVESMKWLDVMGTSLQRGRLNLYAAVIGQTKEDKDFYLKRMGERQTMFSDAYKSYQDVLDRYDPSKVTTEQALLQTVKDKMDAYIAEQTSFINSYVMDSSLQSQAFEQLKDSGKIRDLSLEVDTALSALIQNNLDTSAATNSTNNQQALTTIILSAIMIAIGMGLAIVIGVYISRTISKPVNKLIAVADSMALGDVEVNVQSETKDEIGVLMDSFGKMIDNIRNQAHCVERIANGDFALKCEPRSEKDLLGIKLKQLVEQLCSTLSDIAEASDQIAIGSKQIADSGVSIAQGATEQASSVEELTATMQEIAVKTKASTGNTNKLNDLAQAINSNAAEGSVQMQEMLKAMVEISQASSSINQVIKVIDEIAFQTNILALNAAVEAARAGEAGKGFAVVAEEVRSLASRSSNAAKESTQMIAGSIRKVQAGTDIANNTADALKKIVSGVEKAGQLVNEIANSSNEQAAIIEQVSEGINQISKVVQANSATSEETAALSEESSGQAEILKEMVSQFKLR